MPPYGDNKQDMQGGTSQLPLQLTPGKPGREPGREDAGAVGKWDGVIWPMLHGQGGRGEGQRKLTKQMVDGG